MQPKVRYTAAMMKDKKPMGRPKLDPEDKLELRAIRLNPGHWRKVDALGMEWLRALIERGKPPKLP